MTLDAVLLDGKYETLRKLREGGMGAVYLVRHRLLEELRVVKVMRAQFAGNEEMRERFLREAKSAIQLRHPNIAQLYDFSIDEEGTGVIVMEFIHGATLEQAIALRPLPAPALVVEIALQALRALGFLHKKGFVHRDVAPDNLMFTCDEEGRPLLKLIDLGIARSAAVRSRLTVAGGFLGKLRYASPEAFRPTPSGDQVGPPSDLYSFGVVLYELLTGRYPIVGEGTSGVVTGHLLDPPRSFDETDPEGRICGPLREVVLRALAKTPDTRWESAAAFASALKRIDRRSLGPTLGSASGPGLGPALGGSEWSREAARLFAAAPDFGPEIPLPPLGPPVERRETRDPAASQTRLPLAERTVRLSREELPQPPGGGHLLAGPPVVEKTVSLPRESLPQPVGSSAPESRPGKPAAAGSIPSAGEARAVALARSRELLAAGQVAESEALLAPLLAPGWSEGAALWREIASARQAVGRPPTPPVPQPLAIARSEPTPSREAAGEAPVQLLTAVSGGAALASGGGEAPSESALARALAWGRERAAALPRWARWARWSGAGVAVLLLVLVGWGVTRRPAAVRPRAPSAPGAVPTASVAPPVAQATSPPVFATASPATVPTGVMLVDAAPWAELVELRDERGLLVPLAGERSTPLRLTLPAGRYVARMRSPGSGEIERLPLSVHAGEIEERTASGTRYRLEEYWPGRPPSDLLLLAIDAHLRGAGPQVEGLLASLQVGGRQERAHALLLRAAARYSRYLREGEKDASLRAAAARDLAAAAALSPEARPDTRFFSPRFVGFSGQPPTLR